MAYFKFVDAIARGKTIDVYNYGNMKRDFTYIDDVVEGIARVMVRPPTTVVDAATSLSQALYKIYNIGNHQPVELLQFIGVIEDALGQKADLNLQPMQPGDVLETYADISDLMRDVGFSPSTPIEVGIGKFVAWYRSYYGMDISKPVA